MANWIGTARSNYVHIDDLEGLKKHLERFREIELSENDDPDGRYCLLVVDSDTGAWPTYSWDDEDNECEFDPADLMPFIREGEVLVLMQAGAEKLRYVSGYAEALIRQGGEVRRTSLCLDDIYAKAAEEFKVTQGEISMATY